MRPRARGRAGRRGAGLDHADHRQPGIARRDAPATPTAEAVLQATTSALTPRATSASDGLQRVAHDGLAALGAVGQARGVAEVEEVLVGQARAQRREHGQPADPGIEDADRRVRVRRAQARYSGRRCGNSSTSRIEAESVRSITSRSMPMPRPAGRRHAVLERADVVGVVEHRLVVAGVLARRPGRGSAPPGPRGR